MVKYKIAAVVAEFNYDITQMMLELATAEAKNRDCEITKVVAVPGVFDMPLVIKKLLQKDEYDAIKTLKIDKYSFSDTQVELNVSSSTLKRRIKSAFTKMNSYIK